MAKRIEKRDGRIVSFEPEKMAKAIVKPFRAVGENIKPSMPAEMAAKGLVEQLLEQLFEPVPGIEDVQDIVERALIDEGYSKEAKA